MQESVRSESHYSSTCFQRSCADCEIWRVVRCRYRIVHKKSSRTSVSCPKLIHVICVADAFMDTAWVKTNTTRSAMLVDYYTPSDQGMPTHSDGARVYIVRWLQRVAGKVAVVFIQEPFTINPPSVVVMSFRCGKTEWV
jgi:hypothetical protein